MADQPSTFGSRLAWARGVRGISQKDVALAIGIREKDVSRWEKGHNRPRDHDTIVALARVVGQTTDFLLGANDQDGAPAHPVPTEPAPNDSAAPPSQRSRRRGKRGAR